MTLAVNTPVRHRSGCEGVVIEVRGDRARVRFDWIGSGKAMQDTGWYPIDTLTAIAR